MDSLTDVFEMSHPSVLVTGASQRLGRCMALTLARAGWRVAVHYRHSHEQALQTVHECNELTPGSACFAADLSDESQVNGLMAQVIAHMGTLHAVVNNASLFEFDDVHDFGQEALHQHMLSNTVAPVLLARALYVHVKKQVKQPAGEQRARGVVVNLLDQKLWNQNPDFFSYTLSKAALEAANTMLAHALAPEVRVVGVAPGLTLTSPMLSEEKFRQLHQLSPLGRSSSPEDVAATVRFALENQSITGTTLLVDGGQHLMRFSRDFSMM